MRAPDIDTTRGNPLVLVALVIVAVVLTTVYFREGGSGPLHQARAGVLAVTAPLEQAGSVLTLPFRAVGDFAGGLTVSRSDVDKLRVQNDLLRARVTALQDQQAENARLAALLQLRQSLRLPGFAARVIGLPTNSWEGALVVDRGSLGGVKVGMPVTAAQGLVGQVVEVAPNASKVRLITDRRSGVAVFIQRTRAPGIVQGSLEGAMTLDFVDRKFKTQAGDVVVTSGIGGIYPKGIVVGDVTAIHDQRDKPFPLLTVTSRVPINTVEEVFIVTQPPAKLVTP
jgi:rod shape-determining protein MreC